MVLVCSYSRRRKYERVSAREPQSGWAESVKLLTPQSISGINISQLIRLSTNSNNCG